MSKLMIKLLIVTTLALGVTGCKYQQDRYDKELEALRMDYRRERKTLCAPKGNYMNPERIKCNKAVSEKYEKLGRELNARYPNVNRRLF